MAYLQLNGLTESERAEARSDPELFAFELQKRELELRAQEVKSAKSSTFWEGLQAFMLVGIPIIGYIGVRDFLGLKGKR